MLDANHQRRKAWAFVMTVSHSRQQHVEFVFDQRLEPWLELHRHAFEFCGGVTQRVVTDNLKAAIGRACWEGTDPQAQWAYRECAEHYGFIIAPCRPRPPQPKGKVERGVAYVKTSFLAGRGERPLAQANREARDWCLTRAGQRLHGTTRQRPLEQFERVEHAALHPLPGQPYELAVWKKARLHRDCYVVFDNAILLRPVSLRGTPPAGAGQSP